MIVSLALPTLLLAGVPLVDPGPVDPPPPVESSSPTAHDLAVDGDYFEIFVMREGLCETARAMDADGLPREQIIDDAVAVFTDVDDGGFIDTAEGVIYLRGLLTGCLAVSPS